MQLNQIGLQKEGSEKLAKMLNDLLANYQVFYINSRGIHWNIEGEKFFELHEKFEELYLDSFEKIDEIAERIVTLGLRPDHSYTAYLKKSKIKEVTDVSTARDTVQVVVDGYRTLLEIEREILNLSDELNDEGTNALMSDYIREQEKSIWMYSAFLR